MPSWYSKLKNPEKQEMARYVSTIIADIMANWYSKVKLSYRGTIPKMEDPDERTRDPYGKNPNTFQLTKPAPLWGGKKRKGYPKGVSFLDDDEDILLPNKNLPSENVLMDQEPPTGEGANDERFVADEDKMPIKRKLEPIGPHNMQNKLRGRNIFDLVSQHSRSHF